MPQHLHLDFETFSEADIKRVGAYRYAFDPSTEILCAAMALGDEYPAIWHPNLPDRLASCFEPYWDALENPSVLIYAFSAQFEMAICQALLMKTWGIRCPDLSRFRCIQSMARRAALPAKLDTLGQFLGLKQLKDKKGASLIRIFCQFQTPKKPTKKNPDGVPARRILPTDEPEKFQMLLGYCQQDVRTDQEALHRLAYFDEPINNANYSLDARINARGVTVNMDGLRKAQKLIDEETEVVGRKFRELTGFNFTQGDVLLKWLHGGGCHLDNLQAETIEEYLEKWETVFFYIHPESDSNYFTTKKETESDGMLEEVSEEEYIQFCKEAKRPCDWFPVLALRMKQSVAYASIKKVATMLACAGPHDNRIRGMLNHHGATTGRWTNSLVQFQNMKRATIKNSEDAYRDICAGMSRDEVEIVYGPPLEVISSCIRHFVHDVCPFCSGNGNPSFGLPCPECEGSCEIDFLDADYSAIEARIVCWLAGQEDALQEYRDGVDRYKRMASVIYAVPADDVNKHPQRFVGKQATLGCGFGMGPSKFRGTCKKMGGYDLPLGLEDIAVKAFRRTHKKVVQFWLDIEQAAKQAIIRKGEVWECGKLSFVCKDIEGLTFLFMRLPSGRELAYPKPQVIPHTRFETGTEIVFWGNIKGTKWGLVSTWGGTLAENATQAVAADIMAHGSHNAENAGYEIATLIHDQALAYYQEHQSADEFVSLLTDLPPWADGLPIEAEGGLVPFYKKD